MPTTREHTGPNASAYFESLIEHSQDIIIELDERGRIAFLSPAASRLMGIDASACHGKNVLRFVHRDDRRRAAGELRLACQGIGEPRRMDLHVRGFDGDWRQMECIGSSFRTGSGATHGVINARDVTERRLIEERMLQAQRMESIGRLASGLAHDFNNLLTAIMGFSEIALAKLPPATPCRAEIDEILRAGVRASGLTRQLLAFSRKQILAPRPVPLNATISETCSLLQRLVGEQIQIVTRFDSGAGWVLADPSQLDQMLMNLTVNARDAMPEGGTLSLDTLRARVDARRAALLEVTEGDYVALTLHDTGCGMSPETLAHAFEPFFSTKGPQQGSGLGLATVYGIVRQSGGAITVESAPGKGTTFHVWLPCCAAPDAQAQPLPPPAPVRGRETILLVEDDASIRHVARLALERQGHRVIEASTGEDALRFAASLVGPLDVVITDVVLPGMSGMDLARRLGERRQDLLTLFVSGYPKDVVAGYPLGDGRCEFLQKPFRGDDLVTRVRGLIDSAAVRMGLHRHAG